MSFIRKRDPNVFQYTRTGEEPNRITQTKDLDGFDSKLDFGTFDGIETFMFFVHIRVVVR